jgi:hypothetical protein
MWVASTLKSEARVHFGCSSLPDSPDALFARIALDADRTPHGEPAAVAAHCPLRCLGFTLRCRRTARRARAYPSTMRIFAERLGPRGKKVDSIERPDVPPHRMRQTILALVGELYDKAPEMTGEIRVRLVEE